MGKDENSLGQAIKKRRKEQGMSLAELADACGVSLEAITEIEDGSNRDLSDELLGMISAALGYNFLLTRDIQPNGYSAMGLFCGIGGLDFGFKKAGFEIVYANDNLDKVEATYRYNVGDLEMKDFHDVDKKKLPYADIVLAGIPCQPFSNAGSRKGMKDERGQLFAEVIQTVDAVRPKMVLFENVRGFLSTKDDEGLMMPERLRKELAEHGYRLYYKLLNASDYGVPQNRLRVVLIGVRDDLKGDFRFPEPRTEDRESLTIGATLSKPLPQDEEPEVWKLPPQAQDLVQHVPEGGSWKNVAYEDLPDRLKRIRDNMKRYHAPNFYRRFAREEIMGTITASATPESSGIVHPTEDRRYSVREVARFQSFPDEFKFMGDSIITKYKLIGNAVPVNLAFNLAQAIREFLDGEQEGCVK